MIVVDSSVWIANLRNQPSPEVLLLREIGGREQLLVGDLVLAEVLRGTRDDTHARQVERAMRRHAVMPMLDPDAAVEAARHDRTMRAAGVIIRRTIDLLIGSFCIRHGWSLLHQDRDFDAMERLLGMRVLRAAN